MRSYLSATFASLATRNYRLFFMGQSISQVGNWMQKMAQAWLVLELTNSGVWLGVTVAIQHLPVLLLTPWAGLLADRHHKRTILVWTAAAGAIPALLLGLLALAGLANIGIVLVLALTVGVVDAIEKPTRQALPSELVKPALLANAIILANVVQNAGKALGPAIAGLLISIIGIPYTFLINSASFVAVIWGLLLMDPTQMDQPERVGKHPGQVREGVRYVRSMPQLLGPLVLLAISGLLIFNFQVTLPLLARDAFNGDARAAGYLLGALGVGSILSGLLLAGVLSATLRWVILASLVVSTLVAATGLAPSFTAALILSALFGGANAVFRTLSSTWLQLTAVPAMRGRVMALLVVSIIGTTPFGAPLVGWIATTFGSRAPFIVGGVCTAAATLAVYYYLRTRAPDDLALRRGRRPPGEGALEIEVTASS